MLRDSTVVVRTRPRAMSLPMITTRKSVLGFLFPYMVMGSASNRTGMCVVNLAANAVR